MRGLFYKDFRLVLGRKQTFLIYAVLACIMGMSMPDTLAGFLIMIVLMLAISTIAYDEYDNGYSFLMTLPISRACYAIEKYVFCLISSVIGWGFSMVVMMAANTLRSLPVMTLSSFLGAALLLPVMQLIVLVIVPINLKFGSEKSRVVLMCVYGMMAVLIFGGKKLLEMAGVSMNQLAIVLAQIPTPMMIIGLVILFCLAVLVSVSISIRIMKKKTF